MHSHQYALIVGVGVSLIAVVLLLVGSFELAAAFMAGVSFTVGADLYHDEFLVGDEVGGQG